jgi:dipeptidyl aminopeptidase
LFAISEEKKGEETIKESTKESSQTTSTESYPVHDLKAYEDKYEFDFPVNKSGTPLQYMDIYNGKLRDKGHNINWQAGNSLPDGVYTYLDGETNDIWVKYLNDPDSNKVVANMKSFSKPGFSDSSYELSSDLKYIAIVSNRKTIWRHSALAKYRIYRLDDSSKPPVYVASSPIKSADVADSKVPTLQLFKWSPEGHDLAFVQNNDIYIIKNDFEDIIRVTDNGGATKFNGIPDWVCEEEVFGSDTAMWWSPDGKHLSYLSFDDTEVPVYDYPIYNSARNKQLAKRSNDEDANKQWLEHSRQLLAINPNSKSRFASYPQDVQIRYPKPGFPNPKVSLHIFRLDKWAKDKDYKPQKNLIKVEYSSKKEFTNKVAYPKDPIFTDVVWSADSKSAIVRIANRIQNHIFTAVVDVNDDIAYIVRSEKAGKDYAEGAKGDDAWYATESHPIYSIPANADFGLPNGGYVDRLIKDDHYHFALFDDINEDVPKLFLTSGNYDVEKIEGYNPELGTLYYKSREIDSTASHLFSVTIDGKTKVHISKADKEQTRSNIGNYAASVSPNGGHIVLSYKGPGIPNHSLINSKTVTEKKVLESNPQIKEALQKLSFARYHYRTIKFDGQEFNVKEVRPANFDPTKKYRVLFRVYGGPESQLATRGFGIDYDQWLISNHPDTIIVVFDGRGTGFKGRKFATIIYKQLGLWEAYDVIEAGKYYSKLPYVNPDRIAIWGWSYGGYLTTKTIERNYDNVFKLGLAVAPVTDWRFYDTIYTERYMALPADPPKDHYYTSAVTDVSNFNKTQYVMYHGVADDNVHYQNSLSLIDLFQLNHITKFKANVFPDNDHGLPAFEARFELYTSMVSWLEAI